MPSISEALLRHAQYYVPVAAAADQLYGQGGAQMVEGLRSFDLERAQIDAAWECLLNVEAGTRVFADPLLDVANATTNTGSLRYHAGREGDSIVVRMESRQGRRKVPQRAVEVRVITEEGILQGHGLEGKGISVSSAATAAHEPVSQATP